MTKEYKEMMIVDEVLNEQANVVIFYNGRRNNVLGRHRLDFAPKKK
jgi:hypothetical protein